CYLLSVICYQQEAPSLIRQETDERAYFDKGRTIIRLLRLGQTQGLPLQMLHQAWLILLGQSLSLPAMP
ncbi:MAG: hypothetical protein ACOCVE_07275, partial [Desulfovermiculus sp.]